MKKALLILFLMMILVWLGCDDEGAEPAQQPIDTTRNRPNDTLVIDTSGVDH